MPLRKSKLNALINKSLEEDKAFSDVTSRILLPLDLKVNAQIITKQNCVVCGLDIAKLVFKTLDQGLKFEPLVSDGKFIKKGANLAKIYGRARNILAAERVALNFLSHLSGIATLTRQFVDSVSGTSVKILDTRKTTPLLRELEKYAVRCGGGSNHRFDLANFVLIKDNHKQALAARPKRKLSNLSAIVYQARAKVRSGIKIEIEAENVAEFKQAITAKPDIIMLDNMTVKALRRCALLRDKISPRTSLEASGGINLKNIKKVSKSGVNSISIGSLTHSPLAVDLSLEVFE
jgi:nicotinate-nucleotide pyrophosphorylase (carboxylating)